MFKIVINAHKPENCRVIVSSIALHEPALSPADILVVDDNGLRSHPETKDLPCTFLEGTKPFVFSRNANIGIKHADSDVILLNDDTELMTRGGFTAMAATHNVGITTAKINGPGTYNAAMCSFVAVLIPKSTQDKVGLLDERFVQYGYEDDDYCRRVCAAGMAIHLFEACIVNHYHPDRSTFHGPNNLYQGDNLVAFDRKYGIQREYVWPEHLEQIKCPK